MGPADGVLEKEPAALNARRKQLLLRIPAQLWNDINAWAADDLRSINSQIEYILTEAVKRRKSSK